VWEGLYHVRMRLQDSEDPANRQEVVVRGTPAGLKFQQSVKPQVKGEGRFHWAVKLQLKLTLWPKSSSSKSSEQAASRYSDSKACSRQEGEEGRRRRRGH